MREQGPMTQTMNLKFSEVKNRLSSLVNKVCHEETRVVIEKAGIPVAALVSVDNLARFSRCECLPPLLDP